METSISKINKAAVKSILNELDECSSNETEQIGLNNEAIVQLSLLSLKGQKYIATRADEFISLQFNAKALDEQLKQFKKHDEDYEQENQFLLLGAPYHLMRELFGLHAAEFSLRRKSLGLFNQGRHRPTYCDEETEHKIWYLWHDHQHLTNDIRLRYLTVAQLSEQPINIIWTAINRHSTDSHKTTAKK